MLSIYSLLKGIDNQDANAVEVQIELESNSIDKHEDSDFAELMVKEPNVDYDDIPREPNQRIDRKSGSVRRNAQRSANALATAKYKCEIDNNHETFRLKGKAFDYVEAHHLIPLKYQADFDVSLDVEANIVALCPMCHRKLHHGRIEDIESLLESLLAARSDRMKLCGIYANFESLVKFYDN